MATILVVDDAALDRKIAGACVQAEGCDAIYATNGREALELIASDQPDVVLTDLRMSEINGLELVKQVRRDHPGLPVILMTAHGSEEVAAQALRAGAASYLPKKMLRQNLGDVLHNVLASIDVAEERAQVRELLERTEARFVLGYEPAGPRTLISYLQSDLKRVDFCDQASLLQVSTALTEALANAIDHGNLELDSKLRESEVNAYRQLGAQRASQSPYRDRRVHVTAGLTREAATYVIRDEGPGFDPATLPDPTDPENLLRASGRGVMLIRTFMDEVTFNAIGTEITMTKRRAGR
jgi:CheY-like chemotaxis protein